jgi:hypothetical protein
MLMRGWCDNYAITEGVSHRAFALLSPVVGKDPLQGDTHCVVERQRTVVQQIHRGHEELTQVRLHGSHDAIGIGEIQSVNPPDSIQRPDQVCVDAPEIPRVVAARWYCGSCVSR